MSILILGINHHTGPLSVLERVALASDQLPKAVAAIVQRDSVREAVVVSTCNRTEIYAVTERFHGAYADLRDFLCDLAGIAPDDLHPYLYSEHDDAAVRHLFEVASGLDSAVLGESEILGQIRDAWDTARHEGGAKSTLNLLFRSAIEVGKRVRTDTAIARGTTSVSHAAVELADAHCGGLAGRRVAVVGAGTMGAGIAAAMQAERVAELLVLNRTAARGIELAQRVGATAADYGQLGDVLADIDVVVTGTGAGAPIITADVLRSVRPQGDGVRPLLIVDVAVPRDVAPDVVEIDGVTLLDIDAVNAFAERGRERRRAEVDSVRAIVAEAADGFVLELAALQASPLVSALRGRAEEVRQAELAHHARQLDSLDAAQRDVVEAVTKRILAKLLHEPSVRLRNQAGTPQGARNAAALSDLFDLS